MISFSATYYDGVTTEPNPVVVTLDEQGMLQVTGLPGPLAHPLTAVRISPRIGSTTRSVTFPGGAKCEVTDHAALEELERRVGRGKLNRIVHSLESSWRWAAGAVVAFLLFAVVGAKWGIPLLAQRAADAVPPTMARDLGRGTLEALDGSLLTPSRLTEARQRELDEAFQQMATHYPELPLSLHFRSLRQQPNAFALPDGSVVVTDELVELAKSDDEVMAVLAHEIGHIHHRHSLRMALESSAVVLLLSTYLGDVTQLTTLSAALPAIYAQAHYSRELETEADTFALQYLKENGISRRSFADILRALEAASDAEPQHGLQYLASHPPTRERIARFSE